MCLYFCGGQHALHPFSVVWKSAGFFLCLIAVILCVEWSWSILYTHLFSHLFATALFITNCTVPVDYCEMWHHSGSGNGSCMQFAIDFFACMFARLHTWCCSHDLLADKLYGWCIHVLYTGLRLAAAVYDLWPHLKGNVSLRLHSTLRR